MTKKMWSKKVAVVNLWLAGMITMLLISALSGCASQKPKGAVTQYRFEFENEPYRIRSISSGVNGIPSNELIGKDVLAIDHDKDGILDSIQLGAMALSQAQKIYEHGLHLLDKDKKLQQRTPVLAGYVHETSDLYQEIRSFYPPDRQPFNQFKVIDKRQTINPDLTIAVDRMADGTLDEVLKGNVTPEQLQSRYSELIRLGLKEGKLTQRENRILVRNER